MNRFKFLVILVVITAVCFFVTGCDKEEPKTNGENEVISVEETGLDESGAEFETDEETTTLTVYFSDEQAMYLLPETKEVPKTETPAQAAIEELIKGPEEAGHVSTIPEGTKLNGIKIEEEMAYVDFSEKFKANYQLGSAAEIMTIYSIVNTLTEFPTIKRVKFLVNGEPLEIEGSNFDFKIQDFSRNADLIK
ncbi:GerMN domain-containing protein [Candidatus Oleimmundimicrobium sp.]|uniref:GerMN domain-containing protein n=1 Tax=Candidatus Oleimmundimicrobium sp. TaxID=3060597 RepID=UPI00271A758A|nr:GerMN domain-containing protein [Candidatus Oleimmundimicrobium sp.]MDO8885562.1 GerMN domain-containing protein [Candidatus Oleimmundimicrobium sp.]